VALVKFGSRSCKVRLCNLARNGPVTTQKIHQPREDPTFRKISWRTTSFWAGRGDFAGYQARLPKYHHRRNLFAERWRARWRGWQEPGPSRVAELLDATTGVHFAGLKASAYSVTGRDVSAARLANLVVSPRTWQQAVAGLSRRRHSSRRLAN